MKCVSLTFKIYASKVKRSVYFTSDFQREGLIMSFKKTLSYSTTYNLQPEDKYNFEEEYTILFCGHYISIRRT